MKALLVYNPWAGHGYGGENLPQVESYLNQIQFPYELHLTERPGHGSDIVRNADLSQYSSIIAAGGDGTLFEVLNGYYNNSSAPGLPIGVLPLGTGNAFVRELGLKVTDMQPALDIIAAGKTQKCDVGKFYTQGEAWYFLNILGLGLVADIGATAIKMKFLGRVSYTLSSLYHILRLKPFNVRLEIDGEVIERENVFIEVSNTRYTGADFLMAPNADPQDGKLDVTLLGPKSRIGLMQSFPKIMTGEHIHMKEVETFQAQKIQISTDIPKILIPDGELMGSTPIEITCLKQHIDVFWP